MADQMGDPHAGRVEDGGSATRPSSGARARSFTARRGQVRR